MAEPNHAMISTKIENIQQGNENTPNFSFVIADSTNPGELRSQSDRVRNVQDNLSTQFQSAGNYNSTENAEGNFSMELDNPQNSGSENMTPDMLGSPEIQIHTQGMTVSSHTVASAASVHSPSNEMVVQPIIQVTGVNEETQVYTGGEDTSANSSPCMICNDRGSGYHYSVFSCEGCKGFFKRSVQKNLVYTCKNEGNCIINKFTRNNCQYCRFVKCTQMGMKREAVREDRSPGGKHRNKKPRLDEIRAMVNTDGEVLFVPGVQESKTGETFEDPITEGLINARPDLIPRVDGNICLQSMGINQLMQYGYAELKYIIDWAKKVPGFTELRLEDQMALLKSSFMELNVLRLSYRSMDTGSCIKFAEGLKVPIELAQKMGWGKELVAATVEFSARLKELNIDKVEFCILNGIVLTYPDAQNLVDKQKVILLQTQILDRLRKYHTHKFPGNVKRYGKMLLRLPFLRTVSAKAAERFLSLTLDGTLQLNELVLEMIN
ncbi:retinoic acid receptor RXR-alpha-B-like [Saccostrea echinata]|uniref:retinoic acid receptor RXR-alpha-B-like n=1 Tax=Saccostrea echinata TaxID=191078 RepID=UPI002A7EE36A|nr:retinoic acid receptor RXR-alpha-B-like [Saccostrea echinata]